MDKYIKGQNVRIFIGSKCVGAATSCSIHVAADLEETGTLTKDDAPSSIAETVAFKKQQVTAKSWDGNVSALVLAADTDELMSSARMVGTEVTIKFCQTTGEKNQTAVESVDELTGSAIINDWNANANVGERVTYQLSFTGNGELA